MRSLMKMLLVAAIVSLLLCFCGCDRIVELIYKDAHSYIDIEFEDDGMYVHFIDVGQGDCAVIQTKDGNVLIDAGTGDSCNTIIDYIDWLDITEFEYAIFTHPHEDHIGSAAELIEEYRFNSIILPEATHSTSAFEWMVEAIENEECEVITARSGDSYNLGELLIEILAPDDYYDVEDLNNMSVVSKLTYGSTSFLFTGDAEEESEDAMLYYGYDLDVDILKVGHHGSATSSSEKFLHAVSPTVAIVSAGKDNDYGHPHDEVVERLEEMETDIYITYEVGTVVIHTNGDGYEVITEK